MKAPWYENRTLWLCLTGTFAIANVAAGSSPDGGPLNWIAAAVCVVAFYLWWNMPSKRRPYD